jgi:hypothetical protein
MTGGRLRHPESAAPRSSIDASATVTANSLMRGPAHTATTTPVPPTPRPKPSRAYIEAKITSVAAPTSSASPPRSSSTLTAGSGTSSRPSVFQTRPANTACVPRPRIQLGHPTIVFAVVAVSDWIDCKQAGALRNSPALRRYRTVTIKASGQTLTADAVSDIRDAGRDFIYSVVRASGQIRGNRVRSTTRINLDIDRRVLGQPVA